MYHTRPPRRFLRLLSLPRLLPRARSHHLLRVKQRSHPLRATQRSHLPRETQKFPRLRAMPRSHPLRARRKSRRLREMLRFLHQTPLDPLTSAPRSLFPPSPVLSPSPRSLVLRSLFPQNLAPRSLFPQRLRAPQPSLLQMPRSPKRPQRRREVLERLLPSLRPSP